MVTKLAPDVFFGRIHHCREVAGITLMDCLRTSDTALATIALTAGFSDQSHFSRVFKRQTGVSPAVYRESFAPRNSRAKQCSDRTRR